MTDLTHDQRSLLRTVPGLAEMVRRLVDQFRPLRIILFGSWPRGEATPESDIDLLVVMSEVDDPFALSVAMRASLADLPMPKDIVVTTPDELMRRGLLVGTILRSALRQGEVIYEMDDRELRAVTAQWLQYAREDLAVAESMSRGTVATPRHICFQAQQAAEMALKAALVYLQIDFPRTHELDVLRGLIPAGWAAREALPELTRLSSWSVRERSPGSARAVPQEIPICLDLARDVLDVVEQDLRRQGFTAPDDAGHASEQ